MLFKVKQDKRELDKNEDSNNMGTYESVKCGMYSTQQTIQKNFDSGKGCWGEHRL